MDDCIHIGSDITNFYVAYHVGKGAASSASLHVTVDIVEPYTPSGFVGSVSQVMGIFSCGALCQSALMIHTGKAHFFTIDEKASDGQNPIYELMLLSVESETYLFHRTKIIDSLMMFSVRQTWEAATTMYTTITGVDGSLVGCGILRIPFRNFINELRSFRSVPPATGFIVNLLATIPFVTFFARNLSAYFFAPFRTLQFEYKNMTGH